jgi:EAL domain-containing protein (putative c-di-GMP-specific phosphodiesterase class I)/CheY-like chemotaxis protein
MARTEDDDRFELEQWANLRRHPPGGRLRVVIAERSRLVAEALMFTFDTDPRLDAIGYALDGWEALRLVASHDPDVVVVGAGLPGLDQANFTAVVHESFPSTLLIQLREALIPHEVEAAYADGAADCLTTSCSTDELLHAIRQAENRRIAFARGARAPRYDMAARIRRACDNAELDTFFQPMIELESSDCVAYEALTRFPPETDWTTSDWFAAANALGVGQMVELAAIAAALGHLADIPPTAALAINVSPDVAVTEEFFGLVAPFAGRLIIELTEHAPVTDYQALADSLRDLRVLGARIAIDDVGAGFASFRHILQLSPDIVKLDLSLTRRLEDSSSARALTAALVDFADTTGAVIAAEGIESEIELTLLRELGVHHGQGYLLGYPAHLEAQLN